TRSAVAAAQKLGGEVHVLVLGAEGAAAAAKRPGVAKVLVAKGDSMALAEPVAALLISLAPGYDALLAPGSAAGKNVLPRV
ncbi:electron transfer flavoprotein subunit alpha/FixB family protein, partial [Roseomonas stagni]|nr:electron transfer flavoprotein subunit alpha/FixB family protein [Falsiroseomonas algicola]